MISGKMNDKKNDTGMILAPHQDPSTSLNEFWRNEKGNSFYIWRPSFSLILQATDGVNESGAVLVTDVTSGAAVVEVECALTDVGDHRIFLYLSKNNKS